MIVMWPPQQGHGGGSWLGAIWPLSTLSSRSAGAEGASSSLATECEFVGAMAVGEEAVMANAMETVWQYVKQEVAHELTDFDPHDLALVMAHSPDSPSSGN